MIGCLRALTSSGPTTDKFHIKKVPENAFAPTVMATALSQKGADTPVEADGLDFAGLIKAVTKQVNSLNC